MGLPIKKFISAVNENNEFPTFLRTGVYTNLDPSINCISNAMNVGHPSNLARIFDLYGGQIDERGAIHKVPNMEELRNDILSYSISDEATKETATITTTQNITLIFIRYSKFISFMLLYIIALQS